jgi:hypothetical protein
METDGGGNTTESIMAWLREYYSSLGNLDQALNWIHDNALLIIIFLMILAVFYLRQMSRRLAYIDKVMRDVKWVSSREEKSR